MPAGHETAHPDSHLGGDGGTTETEGSPRQHESRKRGASIVNGDRRSGGATSGTTETHDHDEMFPAWEREQMEDLLNDIRGTLGMSFPRLQACPS
jgi:hypothetical protein